MSKPVPDRHRAGNRLGCFRDELYRVAKGLDVLGRVIWDLDAELFFKRHDQLDCVEAVCAKIVDEGRTLNNFVFFHTQVLNNDLFYTICDVAHLKILILRASGPVGACPRRGT